MHNHNRAFILGLITLLLIPIITVSARFSEDTLLLASTGKQETITPSGPNVPPPITIENTTNLIEFTTLGQGSLYDFGWTPDGLYFVVSSSTGIYRYDYQNASPQLAFGHYPVLLTSRNDAIWIALSSDGLLATSSPVLDQLQVKLWDLETGQEMFAFEVDFLSPVSMVFSPDGGILALGIYDKIYLWNTTTGELLYTLEYDIRFRLSGIAFNAQGTVLAAVGEEDSSIRQWDVQSGQELPSFNDNQAGGLAITFSPDGQYVAVAHGDGEIAIFDAETHELIFTVQGVGGFIRQIGFSPTENMFAATGGEEDVVQLWNWNVRRNLSPMLFGPGGDGFSWKFEFSPDGSFIAIPENGNIVFRDTQSGIEVTTLKEYRSPITALDFSSSGHLLASGHEDGLVRIWQLNTFESLAVFQYFSEAVVWISISEDETLLVSLSSDGLLHIWDIEANQSLAILQTGEVFSAEFTGSSGEALSIASDGQGMIYVQGIAVSVQRSPEDGISTLNSDGSLRASVSENSIILQNETGETLNVLEAYSERSGYVATQVSFNTNGTLLASGFSDGTVHLWGVQP